VASVRASASGWAAVASSTTLTPLSLGATRSGRGGSRRTRSGGGADGRTGGGSAASGGTDRGVDGATRVGRSNVTKLDVGEDDLSIGVVGLDVLGSTRGGGAGSTSDTGGGGVSVDGVGLRVEPEHLGVVVVPDGEDEDVSLGQRLAHLDETAGLLESGVVAEFGLLDVAELVGDGVGGRLARLVGLGVGEYLAVLDVEAADLDEVSGGGVVVGDELGDHGHLLVGVDSLAGSVEAPVTLAEGVEVATVGVAKTFITGVVALGTRAALVATLVDGVARVRGVGGGDGVGLPDIHLSTASTVCSLAGVGAVGRGIPSLNVGL
jgi:hypothetical protein